MWTRRKCLPKQQQTKNKNWLLTPEQELDEISQKKERNEEEEEQHKRIREGNPRRGAKEEEAKKK